MGTPCPLSPRLAVTQSRALGRHQQSRMNIFYDLCLGLWGIELCHHLLDWGVEDCPSSAPRLSDKPDAWGLRSLAHSLFHLQILRTQSLARSQTLTRSLALPLSLSLSLWAFLAHPLLHLLLVFGTPQRIPPPPRGLKRLADGPAIGSEEARRKPALQLPGLQFGVFRVPDPSLESLIGGREKDGCHVRKCLDAESSTRVIRHSGSLLGLRQAIPLHTPS